MTEADIHSDWWSLAACQFRDPEIFFPISARGSGAAQVARAKAVCAQCQVRPQCLSYALSAPQLHGIWGATTRDERLLLRERDRVRKVPAGQPSGRGAAAGWLYLLALGSSRGRLGAGGLAIRNGQRCRGAAGLAVRNGQRRRAAAGLAVRNGLRRRAAAGLAVRNGQRRRAAAGLAVRNGQRRRAAAGLAPELACACLARAGRAGIRRVGRRLLSAGAGRPGSLPSPAPRARPPVARSARVRCG